MLFRSSIGAAALIVALLTATAAQGFDDVRSDRLFIERKPDLDRQPALLPQIGRSESGDRIVKTERRDLCQIGIGRQAKAARRRQAGPGKRRQIGGLRPDP